MCMIFNFRLIDNILIRKVEPKIVKNDVIIREKREIKNNLAAIKYVKNIKKNTV